MVLNIKSDYSCKAFDFSDNPKSRDTRKTNDSPATNLTEAFPKAQRVEMPKPKHLELSIYEFVIDNTVILERYAQRLRYLNRWIYLSSNRWYATCNKLMSDQRYWRLDSSLPEQQTPHYFTSVTHPRKAGVWSVFRSSEEVEDCISVLSCAQPLRVR